MKPVLVFILFPHLISTFYKYRGHAKFLWISWIMHMHIHTLISLKGFFTIKPVWYIGQHLWLCTDAITDSLYNMYNPFLKLLNTLRVILLNNNTRWYYVTCLMWLNLVAISDGSLKRKKNRSKLTIFPPNVFSTNRWNSTCPFINFRRTWDREFMITTNIDSKAKCLMRTASSESWVIHSKRWAFSKASYKGYIPLNYF